MTLGELAYLPLKSDGWSDERIRDEWNVTREAISYLRSSVKDRLDVDTVEEAIRLVRTRIENERDDLPLGPTGWHSGRPKAEVMPPRAEEAFVRYIACGDMEQVADEMGIKVKTVKCYLWKAKDRLGCDSLSEAVEKYLELKGGGLPGYADQLELPEGEDE